MAVIGAEKPSRYRKTGNDSLRPDGCIPFRSGAPITGGASTASPAGVASVLRLRQLGEQFLNDLQQLLP
jgi:hypothetical protein